MDEFEYKESHTKYIDALNKVADHSTLAYKTLIFCTLKDEGPMHFSYAEIEELLYIENVHIDIKSQPLSNEIIMSDNIVELTLITFSSNHFFIQHLKAHLELG